MEKSVLKEQNCLKLQKKRKYTGRVKVACGNCKRAKRCCDDARPCPRCVRLGIEHYCHDASRKDRQDSPKQPALEVAEPNPPRIKTEKTPKSPKEIPPCSPEVGNVISVHPLELAWPDSFDSQGSLYPTYYSYSLPQPDFYPTSAGVHWSDFDFWKEECSDLENQSLVSHLTSDESIGFLIHVYSPLIEQVLSFKTKTLSILQADDSVSVRFPAVEAFEYDFIIETLQSYRLGESLYFPRYPSVSHQTCIWLLKDEVIVNWNEPAWKTFGYEEHDLFSELTWRHFVHSTQRDIVQQGIVNSLANHSSHFIAPFTLIDKQGHSLPVYSTFIIIHPQTAGLPDFPQFILCCHNLY
jgi:PAS domain-containing protein